MYNELFAMQDKYETFCKNLQWHIDTNKPTGEILSILQARIACYEEMLSDIKRLISR